MVNPRHPAAARSRTAQTRDSCRGRRAGSGPRRGRSRHRRLADRRLQAQRFGQAASTSRTESPRTNPVMTSASSALVLVTPVPNSAEANFSVMRPVLEKVFYLDDEDKRLIERRRRPHLMLGFALQLVTVRYLGAFLNDPLDVPTEVIDYVGEQLGIEDPSCVKRYTERRGQPGHRPATRPRREQQAPHRTRPAQGCPPAATRDQLDRLSHQSLVERVDELTQHNQQFSGENERLQQDNEALRHRLAETEDDLAGTRTALRRLLHQANLTDPAGGEALPETDPHR